MLRYKCRRSCLTGPLPIGPEDPACALAFDSKAIREKGLRDFEDYAKELTSVSFGTASPGATPIAFRGTLSQPSGFDTLSS